MSGHDPHELEHARRRATDAKLEPARPKPLPKLPSSDARRVAEKPPAYSDDERTHREGLVQQLQTINLVFQQSIGTGIAQAGRQIEKPEVPARSELSTLLSSAATAALAAASGGIASLLVAPLVETAEQAMVKALITKAVSSAFHFELGPTPHDLSDIAEAYRCQVEDQKQIAVERLAKEWAKTHDALHRLPTVALEALADRASQLDENQAAITIAKQQMLVGWTNFLARAMHGAMHWDPWRPDAVDGGAIKLAGARDPWDQPAATRSDTTTGNVDPKAMSWALEERQRPMMKDHYGILEIFVDTSGRLVELDDYGMRLDNVGPKVRGELRTLGRVRDLDVNKIVRMCSYRHNGVDVDPPAPIASILITADGYVRAHDWARFERVHVEDTFAHRGLLDVKGNFGRCMDQLIGGQETVDCHVDHAAETAEISEFAERAQDLSLSHLKV